MVLDTPCRIELLGGLRVRQGERSITRFQTQKAASLLAYLAYHREQAHPREVLIELLWPNGNLKAGRTSLNTALSSLRRQLEPPGVSRGAVIRADRINVGLNPTAVTTDVSQFHAALHKAEQASSDSERAQYLAQAVALYRGELLPGYYEGWIVAEMVHLDALYSQALQQLESLQQKLGPTLTPIQNPKSKIQNHNVRLPLPFTRFFGREQELGRLQTLLFAGAAVPASLERAVRLVTITGPAGTGKTRLAIEAADSVSDLYEGAVWFVPLADLSDARLVPAQIVTALGLPRSGQVEPMEQAVDFLCKQPSLLLLDNLEHLLSEERRKAEDGAAVVRTLLERVPTLTLLVTSRQPLSLEGERECPLEPLPTPNAEHRTPTELILIESVQLFVDRAQAVKPDFQVTRGNASAVAELCCRLEGIPLAIELAAARASFLPPSQMLAQLVHRFDFLVSRRRDATERHRTLWAAVDWSFQLLSPELQRFFARLSVFRGGWTVEAAGAVCAHPPPAALETQRHREGERQKVKGEREEDKGKGNRDKGKEESFTPSLPHSLTSSPHHLITSSVHHLDTATMLEQLRECSLILTEETSAGLRFRMLETLREFGWEQMPSVERADVQRRHYDFFQRLAAEAERQFHGPEQVVWLDRMEAEHDNLRAALACCKSEASSAETGLRLAGALWYFWWVRGYIGEGREWLRRALSLPGAAGPTQARAKALNGAGNLAWSQGDLSAAYDLLQECLTIFQVLGDRLAISRISSNLANVVADQGNALLARSLYEESLSIQRELGNKTGIANQLCNLGNLAREQGDYAEARSFLEESLVICQELGDRRGIASALNNLGMVTSDYTEARALFEESLAIGRELDHKNGIAMSLLNLGNVVGELGELERMRACYREGLAIDRELHNKLRLPVWLEVLAVVTEDSQLVQPIWTTRLFGAAEALREEIGAPRSPDEGEDYERHLAAARAALGEEAFAEAWAQGCAMTWEQAVAYALEEESG